MTLWDIDKDGLALILHLGPLELQRGSPLSASQAGLMCDVYIYMGWENCGYVLMWDV